MPTIAHEPTSALLSNEVMESEHALTHHGLPLGPAPGLAEGERLPHFVQASIWLCACPQPGEHVCVVVPMYMLRTRSPSTADKLTAAQ